MVEHPVEPRPARCAPRRPARAPPCRACARCRGPRPARWRRREPVVPVGQDDDLAVVADLEELLRTTVHVAHDRLGVDHALAVDDDPQPEHAVSRRRCGPMLRTMSAVARPRRRSPRSGRVGAAETARRLVDLGHGSRLCRGGSGRCRYSRALRPGGDRERGSRSRLGMVGGPSRRGAGQARGPRPASSRKSPKS